MCYSLWYNAKCTHDVAGHRPATSWVNYTTSCNTQSSVPEDGRNHRPKYVEVIGIINKPLLLHLVGCLYYLTEVTLVACRQVYSIIDKFVIYMFSGTY